MWTLLLPFARRCRPTDPWRRLRPIGALAERQPASSPGSPLAGSSPQRVPGRRRSNLPFESTASTGSRPEVDQVSCHSKPISSGGGATEGTGGARPPQGGAGAVTGAAGGMGLLRIRAVPRTAARGIPTIHLQGEKPARTSGWSQGVEPRSPRDRKRDSEVPRRSALRGDRPSDGADQRTAQALPEHRRNRDAWCVGRRRSEHGLPATSEAVRLGRIDRAQPGLHGSPC